MALTRLNTNAYGTSLNLASNVTGTLPAANGGSGRTAVTGNVLQVQQQVITATTSTSSTSFTDTGFSIAITPSSSSNKILCVVNLQSVAKDSGINSGMSIRIVRGSTDIGKTTNHMYEGWTLGGYTTLSLVYLDSPSTTSATTYKATFKNRESNGVMFNAYSGDTSTFTLYEVAG